MASSAVSHSHYFIDHPNHTQRQGPVKTEASASPDLSPAPASLQQFQFTFHSQPSSSHDSLPSSRNPSEPPTTLPPSLYRFGSGYNLMSGQSWPSPGSSQHPSSSLHNAPIAGAGNGHTKYELAALQHTMSYSDDYDDVSELVDISHSGFSGTPGSAGSSGEKTIRRRSSKACDQCRKSKCKCERSAPAEPCKSCVMLGTPCTFLGPSRKRGPPKGYIDAIEARLHQTEALLGIMISASDDRAQSLLRDIAKDPLAKEIINRVDNSPYGVKGRKRDDNGGSGAGGKLRSGHNPSGSDSSMAGQKNDRVDLTSTHPSNEWQDRVSSMLRATTLNRGKAAELDSIDYPHSRQDQQPAPPTATPLPNGRPSLRVSPPRSHINDDNQSPARRQRRRVGEDDLAYRSHEYVYPTNSAPGSAISTSRPRDGHSPGRSGYAYSSATRAAYESLSPVALSQGSKGRRSTSPADSVSSGSEDELTGAVGQLSLNEDEQVRYHGKASGLHLLGAKERVDSRNEGGIWRFPKARVWPPLPSGMTAVGGEDEFVSQLPDQGVQEHLLDLYFTYVHPSFPVVHKQAFFDAFKNGTASGDSPRSPESDATSGSSVSPFNRRRRRVPTLLLLTMYALAARYDTSPPPPTEGSMMWAAGDEYLDRAKVILDGSYASSRPSTCQALLLMGYREIGIGAMAQAWTYVGMAIRMAHDLGMHRSADGWARVDLGGRLFGEWELNERKRIWYACVIMDKYVSTYIGRPLMIFERDFDTPLPGENDSEELEEWSLHSSHTSESNTVIPVPGRIISCFNASATLSGILSMIVQAIYAIRPVSSRHIESAFLEGLLDKWYIELPDHLRHEPGSSKYPVPPPHVLTLHMQYWCAVLLLHRPFIRHVYSIKNKYPGDLSDGEVRAIAEKSYELCAGAANHITSIVLVYLEKYPLSRCAVFLCYYIFTASIMHVTILTAHPSDPQARLGLARCMEALRLMEVVWPSAGRALELLRGSKVNLEESELATLANHPDRNKRTAEQPLDDSFDRVHHSVGNEYVAPRPQNYGSAPYTNQSNYNPPPFSLHQTALVSPNAGPYLYDRWTPDNVPPSEFVGTLSTSVLPQLYSTGFVDERGTPSAHNRVPPGSDQNGPGHPRYPQYWNDYSAFPQLAPAYGGNVHEQASMPQQPTAPQMYLQEPYSIYNNQHASNR